MHGFYGRILEIDLSDRSFRTRELPDEVPSLYLGGKGLGTYLLWKENPPGVDPLDEENRLIFVTGPFTQSPVWGGCRYGVFTKSPLTGIYSESYAGGKVPEAMDRAGYDAVVLKGKSAGPVVLSIHPEGCDFFDAGDLWGMETYAAETEAKKRFAIQREGYGRAGAVVIGPAGERQVRFAVIENDFWRSAGRTGVGAVMGSKRVKALVFQGDRRRPLHDPQGVKEYAKAFSAAAKDNPGVKAYKSLGTTMMVSIMNHVQGFPSHYWRAGTCDHWERISGERYHEEHDIRPNACLKCFMACGRMARITKGPYQGLTIEGPEYETIYAFGGLCMIQEMDRIAHLNDLCDRLGIDTITAGNLCAFAMEAASRGRIDAPLRFGDAEAAAGLIRDMAERTGIGEVLSHGIVHAAREWGMEEVAVHVKGLEPAGYDPRTLKGMGLAYATSDRGACHLRTTFYKPELAGMIAPDTIEGKAELLVDFEDRLTLFDSLILCKFYRDLYPWEELEKVVALVTGLDSSPAELRRRAEAITTLTRRFNLREGLDPKDDALPARIHKEPLPTGQSLTREELQTMLGEYYRLHGWDAEGRPAPEGTPPA